MENDAEEDSGHAGREYAARRSVRGAYQTVGQVPLPPLVKPKGGPNKFSAPGFGIAKFWNSRSFRHILELPDFAIPRPSEFCSDVGANSCNSGVNEFSGKGQENT